MSPRIPRAGATRLATVTALVAAGLAATAAGATGNAGRDDAPRELARAADGDTTQIVMVKAPTVWGTMTDGASGPVVSTSLSP